MTGWRGLGRLLVMRLDNIGDVVMAGPALAALRRGLPEARLTLMASPAGAQVAPLLPWIDAVRVERALWQQLEAPAPDPAAEEALARRIAQGGFDGAVVLTSFSQSPHPAAFLCRRAGIPRVAGASDETGAALTDRIAKGARARHQVLRNLDLVGALGFAGADPLSLRLPPGAERAADAVLAAAGVARGAPFVLAAPFASAPARTYPPERMAEALRLIGRRGGRPVLVTAAPGDRARAGRLARDAGAVDLAGRTDVPTLAALARRACLVVTVNTSAMHLADAWGTPAVVLFGGTERPEQWRPRRSPHVLLRRATGCSPCHRIACPHALECLDIAPAEVADAALASVPPRRARLP